MERVFCFRRFLPISLRFVVAPSARTVEMRRRRSTARFASSYFPSRARSLVFLLFLFQSVKIATAFVLFRSQHIKNSTASLSSSFNPSFLSLSSLSGYAFTTTSAVPSSGKGVIAATSNITCFVNPSTGTVTNLQQSSKLACTAGGERVVIPSAGKYVTKMEMAVDKELPLVGRFVFHVRDTLESKPAAYTCGFAGGEAISLFPSGYIATSIDVGCIPLTPQAIGKRRRRLSLVAKNAANPELVRVFFPFGRGFWRRREMLLAEEYVFGGGRRCRSRRTEVF